MDFQPVDKKTNAGRFERGELKVTTVIFTCCTLSRRKKTVENNFLMVS